MTRFASLFPTAEAIIFDLGGVVFDIDYQCTQKAFEQLGFTHFAEIYSQAKQSGLFDRLETGKIPATAFRREIRALVPALSLSDSQINEAWSAMLLDLPKERLLLLEKLKKEYRTFLLSNTNELHLEALAGYLQQMYGSSSLSPYFEKDYYSSIIGFRKPDIESYEYVLHENNLNPQTTVFIDDLPQNIEGAKRARLLTYHLTGGETITDLFSLK